MPISPLPPGRILTVTCRRETVPPPSDAAAASYALFFGIAAEARFAATLVAGVVCEQRFAPGTPRARPGLVKVGAGAYHNDGLDSFLQGIPASASSRRGWLGQGHHAEGG